MSGTFSKDISPGHFPNVPFYKSVLAAARGPMLILAVEFVPPPQIVEVNAWEIVTWKVAFGNMPLEKYPSPYYHHHNIYFIILA